MDQLNIAIGLRGLNHKIGRFIDKNLNKRTVERVTGTNSGIILYIAENAGRDICQRDIEREFGITRSTTSKIVNLMVGKGLIVCEPVESDGRLKKLVLTPRALELAALMEDDSVEIERRITRGFSEEELDTLMTCIRRMERNIED